MTEPEQTDVQKKEAKQLETLENRHDIDIWQPHDVRIDVFFDSYSVPEEFSKIICVCGSSHFECFQGGPQSYETSLKCVKCGVSAVVHSG